MGKKYFKLTSFIILTFSIFVGFFSAQYILNPTTTDKLTLETFKISRKNINIINTGNQVESLNEVEQLQTQYQNSDIKAILSIPNSTINIPVVQTTDNNYYLTHNYHKEYDKLGSVYADYRIDLDTSQKKLIFGHSSTKSNTPFNNLENYYQEDYYQTHKFINLTTKTTTYQYEIFSVHIETSDFTYMNLQFANKDIWYHHLLTLQNKSLYQTNIQLTEEDDILILQTCSNHPDYQNNSKKYLLIVSRRVK